jgi:hypothetical protein
LRNPEVHVKDEKAGEEENRPNHLMTILNDTSDTMAI